MNFINRKPINGYRIIFIILLYLNVSFQYTDHTNENDEMSFWAETFGDELWELGQRMTKSPEIKEKYKLFNARVERKNGTSLVESIAENVGRMLASKMDAVKRIWNMAEEMSESFDYEIFAKNYSYFSSKFSTFNDIPKILNDSESVFGNSWLYRPVYTEEDSHFFNISVNTTHSSVHVPTNVYDRSIEASTAIQWSEKLDEIFLQNYNSDPALSWQYFCSETGVFRHYPAMEWETDEDAVDLYDCRRRSWYIEAATCSKDVVLLVDNSGSMTGFRNYIAKLTVRKIMDTFSNNDFLNIYTYSADVKPVVECFDDYLVQATPENIRVFNEKIEEFEDPEGYANVSKAFIKAFELLEDYRINIRRCNESAQGCNQAIMLITDGVADNITEFDKYNRIETMNGNGTKIPVRVFTYLLGQEVTKVREIQWMACLNRGYYSHIKTMDEVSEDVLKYVDVIATPLVLQGNEHPPTWTHAFVDLTHQHSDSNERRRLMIAVGAPAFDKKQYNKNDTKQANLLGVAGTDVPIEEIDKLSLPYKLGVNGYSFIVSNNGYVLLHPNLEPVFEEQLKDNYNSIDFAEVEQLDDDRSPRDPSPLLLQLREKIILAKTVDEMLNISVKFHYDKMRRIIVQNQDYYFAALPNTPFALGLVLPSNYGKTWIKVGEEVKRNQHMGINFVDFFAGENWKLHPDWVYCKYHYLEGHEFKNPEEELLHFLRKLNDTNFQWSQQYETLDSFENINCDGKCSGSNRRTLDLDAYYCNKELFQLLIFDAKVTNTSYSGAKWDEDNIENELILKYNAALRFVATMSGLTRWQFIFGENENNTAREFGDYHTKAVDETWYISAVLQYQIDPESFVYSVPHYGDAPEDEDLKVTASLAIVPRDGGERAPGCVVGFQFSHTLMYERFREITSKTKGHSCLQTCDSEDQECYVIDNNGYIILSERQNDTGRFFGEVEGGIMTEMVTAQIFQQITVYDLQGWCKNVTEQESRGNRLSTPMKLVVSGIGWLFTELIYYLSKLSMWVSASSDLDDYDYQILDTDSARQPVLRKGTNSEDEDYFKRPKVKKNETVYFACDKESTLYVLNQNMFIKRSEEVKADLNTKNCSRSYFTKRIPHTNLLLVVVNKLFPQDYITLSTLPEVYTHEKEFPCYKLQMNNYSRRRLEDCFTEHPDEAEYHQCGGANQLFVNYNLEDYKKLFILVIVLLKYLLN